MSRDFEDGEELHDQRPKGAGPILQERKKGHELLQVGRDTFVEVSKFKGKVYASIRVWFQTEEGEWMRTKKGITLEVGAYKKLFNELDVTGMLAFVETQEADPWEE